jgi:hypothetical protein
MSSQPEGESLIMTGRNFRIAVGAAVIALTATVAIDSASAQRKSYATTSQNLLLQFRERRPEMLSTSRIPPPGAASRPTSRDMRGMPSMAGRAPRVPRGGRATGSLGRR